MRMKQWENQFFRQLKPLPKEERERILEYYREMYGDKREAGFSEEEILLEFGSPAACAARILNEEREAGAPAVSSRPSHGTGWGTVKWILGILIGLPLLIALGSVVVSFGSVAVAGIGISLGGCFLCIWSAFQFSAVSYGLALLGTGLMMLGAGLGLFVGFWSAAKYTAVGIMIGCKAFFKGRGQDE